MWNAAKIIHNTFIDCRYALLVGVNHSKHPIGNVPSDYTIVNNLFFNKSESDQVVELVKNDKPENRKWANNIFQDKLGIPPSDGLLSQDPHLSLLKHGLAIPSKKTQSVKQFVSDKKEFSEDIFSMVRKKITTVGTIEFSKNMLARGPLTEIQVGLKSPVLSTQSEKK